MPDTVTRFALASGAPAGTRADVLVLFAEEAPRPNGAVAEINQALAGQLLRAAAEEGFRGKPDQIFVLTPTGGCPPRGWCWWARGRRGAPTPRCSGRRLAAR